MFKSKEIRWFTKKEDESIIRWFEGQGKSLLNVSSRDDFYLPLPSNNLSIKLREGKIEAKHRVGEHSEVQVSESVAGIMETWIKWSFQVDSKDELSKDILFGDKFDWTRVTKERLGVKISENRSGDYEIHDISEFVPSGCQIEYTRIRLNEVTYYTLGFEWFGEQFIEPDRALLNQIFQGVSLDQTHSMGYSQFLLNNRSI